MNSGGIFEQGIYSLQNLGVLDVLLPFILIFTIVFAVMQKTKILGEGKKNFNVVIALVMGFAVIVPHVLGTYPSPDSDIVNIINLALPNISGVLIAVIMMLLVIGVFGGDVNIAGSSLAGYAVGFSILATLYIFGSAAKWFEVPMWLNFLNDSDTAALIVVILVFGAVIMFVTGEDKPKDSKEPTFMDGLAKAMKK